VWNDAEADDETWIPMNLAEVMCNAAALGIGQFASEYGVTLPQKPLCPPCESYSETSDEIELAPSPIHPEMAYKNFTRQPVDLTLPWLGISPRQGGSLNCTGHVSPKRSPLEVNVARGGSHGRYPTIRPPSIFDSLR